jgi:hypothetical protein
LLKIKEMKVKWREYERLLVTAMTLLGIGILTVQHFTQPHVLLPQAGSLLLLYLAYSAINFAVVPMMVKAAVQPAGRWPRLAGALTLFFALSYILGPVINFISFYAGPGYKGFEGAPLTFGSHPQPFLNLFGGWNTALMLVGLYFFYGLAREWIIFQLEKSGPRLAYRVLVSNQATVFAAAFLCIPYVTAVFDLAHPLFYHVYFALVPPVFLVWIGTYYWLFPAYEGKSRRRPEFLMKLLFYVACTTAPFSLFLAEAWTPSLLTALIAGQLLLTLPVSWLFYRARKDTLLQLRGFENQLARSNAGLQALRSQINPHFLFNALNALYATALREGSPDTARGIQQLGDMMRFMLHDNQRDLIPMSSELEYLNNYIALQKLRIQESDNMILDIDVHDQDCSFLIAPMLLIPFVENAFKHGISLEQKSWICIDLDCGGGQLNFRVRNSLHTALANDTEQGRSGIGLRNVKERLQIFYPGRHELNFGPKADEFVIDLQINTKS